jgi:hypothetical protein
MEPASRIPTHPTRVEISPPIPSDLEAGSAFSFKIGVTCASGCDLRGRSVTILASDGVVMVSELVTFVDRINGAAECTVTAPAQTGDHAWTVLFARHEAEGCIHEESRSTISFSTTPHMTSVIVWDIPSPVVVNRPFTANVGVKCSTGCSLKGGLVEIRDEAGRTIGEGRVAGTPWPGTDSLYWTAVMLTAPSREGAYSWSARLRAAELASAHEGPAAPFSFRAAQPPEHTVRIEVTGQKTGRPIEGIEVRLGAYECFTDARGQAMVEVPRGTYRLSIRGDGYTSPPTLVDVEGDVTVQVQASTAPTKAQTEAPVGIGHPYAD